MYYLGVDLGTSAVKVIAMSSEGDIIGETEVAYPLYSPQKGWAQQDPEDWWQGTQKAIKTLLKSHPQLTIQTSALGFSGQMHGLVALDKSHKVLTPAILWCDQRTQKECDDITDHFTSDGLAKHVANQALTGFTAPKLLWLKRNQPHVYKAIAHVLLPKDYIRFKLTGDLAMDYSDASGTLLLNVKEKTWSKDMCHFLDLPQTALPELCDSWQVRGTIHEHVAQDLGFKCKVMVVAGAGDQAAGAVGCGAVEPGILSVSLGTSGVVFAPHKGFTLDAKMRLHAFCDAQGGYHAMGVMLSAASALKWWYEISKAPSFETLLEKATYAHGASEDLFFLPYLVGERTPYPDPDIRAAFIGMTPTTSRGMMTRAVLEGVAFGLKDSLDLMANLDIPLHHVRLIGGGAKSTLWRQVMADVLGVPVHIVNTQQGGALGAAILAAVGHGAFATVQEACHELISVEAIFTPDPNMQAMYLKKHQRFQALYPHLAPWFKPK